MELNEEPQNSQEFTFYQGNTYEYSFLEIIEDVTLLVWKIKNEKLFLILNGNWGNCYVQMFIT